MNPVQNIALLALRLIIAMIFLYAGYAKLFIWSGTPEGVSLNMANLIKFLSIVEPLGAVALIAGFLTRLASSGLAIIMAGAIYFLYSTMNVGLFTTPQGAGWDYNLLILGGCIALAAFGAGKWSVDAMQKKYKNSKNLKL